MTFKKKDNKRIKIIDSKIEEYPIFCFKHLTLIRTIVLNIFKMIKIYSILNQ